MVEKIIWNILYSFAVENAWLHMTTHETYLLLLYVFFIQEQSVIIYFKKNMLHCFYISCIITSKREGTIKLSWTPFLSVLVLFASLEVNSSLQANTYYFIVFILFPVFDIILFACIFIPLWRIGILKCNSSNYWTMQRCSFLKWLLLPTLRHYLIILPY